MKGIENRLLERIREGDKSAFNILLSRYHTYCRNIARRIVKDPDIAEDMVQNAFIQAYFCISNLRDAASFKYWLGGIVANICKSYLRRLKKHTLSIQDYHATFDNSELTGDETIVHIVLEALSQLTAIDSEILSDFYYEKKRLSRIAEEKQITENSAKVRLHRARSHLKAVLEKDNTLNDFQQYVINKERMKPVTIIDFVIKATTDARCAILLFDKQSEKVLTIVISTEEAEAIVRSIKKIRMPRPMTFDLMSALIKNTNLIPEGAYINDVSDGILIAALKIRRGSETMEFDARPSDAIAIALMFDAPVYVSQKVIDSAAFPVPKKYQNHPATKRGLEVLVKKIQEEISNISAHKAASRKTIPRSTVKSNFDNMMDFVFGPPQRM